MKATPPPDPTPAPSVPPAEPAAAPPPEPAPAEPPAATAPAPPESATWPEWFAAVDLALAVLVFAAAFLTASFAARNSDVWLHLAAGRNIAHGQLALGTDPFSYSGADRPWVQSSWLFDVLLYALYSLDIGGAVAVGVKAACVAAAFGLLFLLRRPGFALWPWAVAALLGVLAAAPLTTLRPISVSMLFLAATFVLLYRRPWSPTGWRGPGYLIGLFWLWGNVDVWALLGPVTAAVVLLGEYLNRFLVKDEMPDPADPFPAAPPLPALGKAVALGFVAVLLNPTFLAAAVKDPGEAFVQLLPAELGVGIPPAADDVELSILGRSPLDSDFQSKTNLGRNVNGGSFAALLVCGALVLLAGFGRLRATHILLWLLFAGLALTHVRGIPFFAVAAVPLVAGHVNGLSSRVRLGLLTDPGTRVLLTASAMGRVLSVLAVLAVTAATYPGWVHPPQFDPAYNNRLDWSVAAEPGLVRAAERLNGWRADGSLPEAARGLNVSTDFGNYCAWYAPREKVFVNGRFNFHRHELRDLLTVRQQVAVRTVARDAGPDVEEVWRVCEARSADYLVVSTVNNRVSEIGTFVLMDAEDRWVPWYLSGRAVVLGRVSSPQTAALSSRLKFDPVREAFAPGQPLLPDGKAAAPPPAKEELADQFTDRPKIPGPRSDDALILVVYNKVHGDRADVAWNQKMVTARETWAGVGGPAAAFFWPRLPRPVGDAEFALPVLAIRAARLAVAEDPDRPEPYRTLALAYQQRFAPVFDLQQLPMLGMGEVQAQAIAGRARFLARLPDPEKAQVPANLRDAAFREAFSLAQDYQQTGQLDIRLDTIRRMIETARTMSPDDVRRYLEQTIQLPPSEDPMKILDKVKSDMTRQIQPQIDSVEQIPNTVQRFAQAQGRGLPGLAIKVFLDNPKEFGARYPDAFVQVIAMELRAGRLEDAAVHLDLIDDKIKEEENEGKKFSPEFVDAVRQLKSLKYRLEGNYEALAESLGEVGPQKADPVRLRAAAEFGHVVEGSAAVAGPPVLVSGQMFDPRTTRRPPVMPLDVIGQTRMLLGYESAYQYDRAMAAVVRGDLAEAKRRLEFARAPQGVNLAKLNEYDRLGRIEMYLQMITRPESAAK